jgi:protocatechuate 3,4-dioxygenase beta subunit
LNYNINMDKKKSEIKEAKYAHVSTQRNREPTPETMEGPYYKPGSPERTKLYAEGVPGEKLKLTGYVFDTDGKKAPHAWLDFWQANGIGRYDNSGYTLRGHQYTDESGKYVLETVVPGGYAVRTPHVHVKLRLSEDDPIFTTQLFLPGLVSNKTDFIFQEALLMDVKDTADGKSATFDFVLKPV